MSRSTHCNQIRTALSARLDGEPEGLDAATIDRHLASCGECRAFADGAAALHRLTRVSPAPAVPDLTPSIVAALDAEGATTRRADRSVGLRILLAVVAIVELAVAVPALVLGDDAGLPAHEARHMGSFLAALAIGLLVAAWRPERAAGVLPIVAAFVIFGLVTAVTDVANGTATASSELWHNVPIAGLLILGLLVRETRHQVPPSRRLAIP